MFKSDADGAQSALEELLQAQETAALSVTLDGAPWVCTVYFAAGWPDLYLTSQPTTAHVAALAASPAAAVAVWRRPERWGGTIAGVQLRGVCAAVEDAEEAANGLCALHARFPAMKDALVDVADVIGAERKTCMLRFRVANGVVVDEARLGRRNFVPFDVIDA